MLQVTCKIGVGEWDLVFTFLEVLPQDPKPQGDRGYALPAAPHLQTPHPEPVIACLISNSRIDLDAQALWRPNSRQPKLPAQMHVRLRMQEKPPAERTPQPPSMVDFVSRLFVSVVRFFCLVFLGLEIFVWAGLQQAMYLRGAHIRCSTTYLDGQGA